MRKLAVLLFLPLAFSAAHPAQAATAPGAIPGSFGVSETGAATYNIPIAVPPGTAGMEPKLSFNYSSQGGNGIAGVGWSLGGLSAITRCPQTIAQDGQTRGVQLDANDRFCLDGQRLIVVGGATYGAIGAEYRTELESFSRVVSYGGTAGDPQYFKVWTKAGQIIEFGNTIDSRVEAQGKSIAGAWAANGISDTVGNYLAFTYFEDNASGEHRIERIDYTGNAAASVSPYNAVEFQYETRPDPSSGYLVGSLSQQTQRLARVIARANGVLTMDYILAYETGTTTGRSRLASLTRCEANGDCLNPTAFGWQEGEAASFESVAVETVAPTGSINDTWFSMGDLNADGKTDSFFMKGNSFYQYLASGNDGSYSAGNVSAVSGSPSPLWIPSLVKLFLVDTNGDGYSDPVLCGATEAADWWVKWNIHSFKNDAGNINASSRLDKYLAWEDARWAWPNYEWCQPAETNGDGRMDMMPYLSNLSAGGLSNKLMLLNSNGSDGFTGFYRSVSDPALSTSTAFYSANVSGDGKDDAVRYDFGDGRLRIWTSDGIAFPVTPSSMTLDAGGSPYDRWFNVADVNGDGLGDMVQYTPADGKLKVWLSKGNGTVTAKFETTGFSTGGTPSNTWFLMVDVNADGRADAVKYTSGTGNIVFAISNGNGTFGAPINAVIANGFNPTPTIGPNPTTAWFQPADVNGDGLLDWVIYHPGEGKIKVNLGKGAVPDLLLAITDGHGATRTITYKPLTDASVYTKGTGATYPTQDVQNATYVVAETAADDGIGGQYRIAYRYEGARANLHGRGFLGFAALEQTDLQTGIVSRTNYRQDFPYIGQATLATQTSSGGVELKRVESTHAVKVIPGGGQFVYSSYSKEQGNDLNATVLPSTETWNTYGDDWGNLTQVITQTSDGFKKQTDNTYTNDAAKWHLGRLTRASVTSTLISNGGAQTRVSAFEYSPTTGLLTKEIIEPDAANVQSRLDTDYTHDAFGNRNAVTISSPATGTAAITARTTTTNFDTKGQFNTSAANAVGHTETKAYDTRFGGIATLTGPNNLTTTWQYDGFGRKTKETRADGTYTIWSYLACDAACPSGGVYRIVTQIYAPGDVQAAPASVVYHDRLNRPLRNATQGFDGRWIYTDTQYDNRGNVDKISRPYYVGDTIYWIDHTHDDLNRLVQVIEPDNLAKPALVVAYNGLTVTRTNRKDQTTSETHDSQGRKVSVTDALSQIVTYAYDPFGNLVKTTDPAGNQIVNDYDIRGRKIQTIDPDLGLWRYDYNALGELVKQTDAKSQVTDLSYDLLGRMTQRIEGGVNGMTSNWYYDTAARGKGKLQRATTNTGYSRTHSYDSFGRLFQTVSNLGTGAFFVLTSTSFDTAGRVLSQYYPNGVRIKNIYNALGYLAEIRHHSSNALYWQLNAQDAEGHTTQETYGNGVITNRSFDSLNGRLQNITGYNGATQIQSHAYLYDTLGNVRTRKDDLNSFYDYDTYDNLNRLRQTTAIVKGVSSITSTTYDAIGNIQSKTGVGTYTYNDPAHKHAVTEAGSNSYTYDPNGNLTAGAGRTLTWTAWNMPASITQSGQTQSWLYTPEHDRYKLTASGRTTWYLNPSVHQGGHYEQTLYASGTREHRITLYGGGKPIGEFLTFALPDGSTPPASQTRYFHSDAQGSITAVTDQTGAVINRYRYDPWGKQTLVSGSNTGIEQTRQGHTGHEMLDSGLTHMNGRLYDPVLSRFVSADPIVQAPYNLQSLNRYSYVWNNPLGYTDPSGYFGWEISPSLGRGLFTLGGIMFGAVLGPAGPIFAGGGWATTLASGALAGGVGGFIGSRGDPQAARMGALSGGLFAGAGLIGNKFGLANDSLGRAALHAAAGCISASAGGGSCGTGAMTAGFTKFASENLPYTGSDFGELVKYSVIGGTASVIGGEKFANGAMTGAWQYLMNAATSKKWANTMAQCQASSPTCVPAKLPDGRWAWMSPEGARQMTQVKFTNANTIDDLTTTPAEARKIAQGSLLAVGLVATPLGAGGLATYSLLGGAALTVTDPNASFDDYASTAVSFATRGLGNYGAGTWVENFANGVESYNTIWQIGDFAKKNQ